MVLVVDGLSFIENSIRYCHMSQLIGHFGHIRHYDMGSCIFFAGLLLLPVVQSLFGQSKKDRG